MAVNFISSIIANTLLFPVRLFRAFSFAPTPTKRKMPKYYTEDPAWADVLPLAQEDGGMHPLAAIAYTEEYSSAMGYLRALMAANEFSERGLALTEHIINMNPAHYTVW
jgi:protein farnesyltransferase/geranylgeranyltransferase type-1 subunit alpha